MKRNKRKIASIIIITSIIISIGINAYGHSGRTDSRGGHKDNQNKSGLGSYHYHCGGNPAHLHPNGVCPYSSDSSDHTGSTSYSSSSSSSNSSSNSSSKKANTMTKNEKKEQTKPTSIDVTEIKINEKLEELKIGEKRSLTVSISPENATDKTVTWKSSDESILTVSQNGDIEAKKAGKAEISVTSLNGKSDKIEILVKEDKSVEDAVQTMASSNSANSTNIASKSSEGENSDSNPVAGIATLGLLGGAGYWGYNKFKGK